MKNMGLSEFWGLFSSVPRDRVYLQGQTRTIHYGDVVDRLADFQHTYPELVGANCSLSSACQFDLAEYLPLVAALVGKLFLKPRGLSESATEVFNDIATINYELKIDNGVLTVITINQAGNSFVTEQRWLLPTSGTTGEPKLACYLFSSLIDSSQKDFRKGQKYIWGLCYDLSRFAGLQVYFQSVASGSTLVVSDRKGDLLDTSLFLMKKVNCLSATPSYWRKLLMISGVQELSLLRITLGGEIADQAVLDALKTRFPCARVVHIYASTEAGVGFSVKDGQAGFPRSYLDGDGVSDIHLKVINDTLWLKSHRAAECLLNVNLDRIDNYIDSGDLVEVCDDRVQFLGRRSGTINVGGDKVTPEEVEAILNTHPKVIISRVFGKKSSMLGMLVGAEIVLAVGEHDKITLKKDLTAYCKKSLARHKVPAVFKFVDTIDMNASGKLVRN